MGGYYCNNCSGSVPTTIVPLVLLLLLLLLIRISKDKYNSSTNSLASLAHDPFYLYFFRPTPPISPLFNINPHHHTLVHRTPPPFLISILHCSIPFTLPMFMIIMVCPSPPSTKPPPPHNHPLLLSTATNIHPRPPYSPYYQQQPPPTTNHFIPLLRTTASLSLFLS